MPDIVEKTAAFQEATVEKVPVNSNDVTNKQYVDSIAAADLTAITSNVVANIDNTYDLGSQAKKWKDIHAYNAFFALAVIIGGILIVWDSNLDALAFNASIVVNGSINATGNITASYFYGDGSLLTGLTTGGNSSQEIIDAVNFTGTYDLTANKSLYWDELNSPSDINAADITDDDTFALTASEETFDENIIFAKNISQGDNDYHVFGDGDDAYVYFNGSTLIIKVN